MDGPFLLFIVFFQRGTQKVSKLCRILVGCFLLLIADRLYLALQGTVSWLDWLYFLSTVKIAITLIKYIPQAYYNYRRQSTKGVAIQGKARKIYFIHLMNSILPSFGNYMSWGEHYEFDKNVM